MDKLFHPVLYNGCNYLSMLGLKLIHVSKRGHWYAVNALKLTKNLGAVACICKLVRLRYNKRKTNNLKHENIYND